MLDKTAQAPLSASLLLAGDAPPMRVETRGPQLTATREGAEIVSLRFDEANARLDLVGRSGEACLDERAMSAIIEALFGWRPSLAAVDLDIAPTADPDGVLGRRLVHTGLAVSRPDGPLVIRPDLAMQRRDNWLTDAPLAPYPLDYTMSEGRRHPRRPPKPAGTLYVRHIPWLDQAISFRALTLDDLPLFHRWMNDPRVNAFWSEAGSIDAHRTYLSNLIADPHMLPLVGCFDDQPFGYFEIYWAKENRIAPFYDADDYDRGWHVAVGEDAFRGRRFVSAWLPSLMHYMFLDDPRTQRIVGEPAATHVQQIRNLEVSGFAKLKAFDFPHKRAVLVMLLRERFFEGRLWLPAAGTDRAT